MTMLVSISAYNDADLLRECLRSVRERLPSAHVQVVDGRYETWPDGRDNSTDDTRQVAEAAAAEYVPGGPYADEAAKHRHRVELARQYNPAGWALFLDADERLLAFERDHLDPETAYHPRIFNPLVYGPLAVYWPRLFKPYMVAGVGGWDAYRFSEPTARTDAVTIVHRHDLRGRAYRVAKHQRFANEGRESRYEAHDAEPSPEAYLNGELPLPDLWPCPECGETAVSRSQATPHHPVRGMTRVECCVASDGCYARVCDEQLDGWEYLPDEWAVGMVEDPERVRLELTDAGCAWAAAMSPEQFAAHAEAAVGLWVEDNLLSDAAA